MIILKDDNVGCLIANANLNNFLTKNVTFVIVTVHNGHYNFLVMRMHIDIVIELGLGWNA